MVKRILLTGARAPATLDLARQFHAAGHQVWLADRLRFSPARGSRAVTGIYPLPPARDDPLAYALALRDLVRALKIDFLMPTCEEIFFIARHAALLRAETELFCEDLPPLARLHDKYLFAREGAAGQVCPPATDLLRSRADVAASAGRAARSVYKPVFSRFASHVLVSPGPARLKRITPTEEYPWVRQDRVQGVEYCTWSAARQGRLLAHACYQPAYRLSGGAGYYFLPVHKPVIQDYVADFVRRRNFTGQIAFDLIEDAAGRCASLECNPRLTSGVHLFPRDGRLAAALLGDGPAVDAPLTPPLDAPAMLAFGMVANGLPRALLGGRIRPFLADFARAGDVIFRRDDPWPALMQFLAVCEYVARGLLERRSPQAAATRDIEWNGEPM